MKKKKKKNYDRRAKIYRGAGLATIGLTTTSGFLAYQAAVDWGNFEEEINNFILVQEESLKLNMTIAIPFLVGMLVFFYVMRKKNKDYFADKVSINILILLLFLYLVYSVIEVAMVSLGGAFVGTSIDETLFLPLSKKCRKIADDDKDTGREYEKETMRIKARRAAESDLDGSV